MGVSFRPILASLALHFLFCFLLLGYLKGTKKLHNESILDVQIVSLERLGVQEEKIKGPKIKRVIKSKPSASVKSSKSKAISPPKLIKKLKLAKSSFKASKENSSFRPLPVKVEKNFHHVLKDLTKASTGDEEDIKAHEGATSDHITLSEIDRVKKQIQSCWRRPVGAIEDLSVEIEMIMQPDGTVSSLKVKNYIFHPLFRVFAESAERAIRDTKCQPLLFPPDKYDQWKEVIIEFNAKDLMRSE